MDLQYIEQFNKLYDDLRDSGIELKPEHTTILMGAVKRSYGRGWKAGELSAQQAKEEAYNEGRLLGQSLGYQEGVEAGKDLKRKRLMAVYNR